MSTAAEYRLDLTPLASAERATMQKLFISGHLLPGVDLSAAAMEDFMRGLGKVTGMNVFFGPIAKTPDQYDEETKIRLGGRPPDDINIVVMWDDSGAQLYIFPTKENWCTVDIYTCKTFAAEPVLRYVYDRLGFREDMQFSEQTDEEVTPWQAYRLPEERSLVPESPYLEELSAILAVDFRDISKAFTAGRRLESIVYMAIAAGWGSRLAALFTPEQKKRLQQIHGIYEVAVDAAFMEAVLKGEINTPDQYPFQVTYDRLSRMEGNVVAGLKLGDRVMHIGTGWPGTAIGLHRQFGVAVTLVEKNPEVARQSAAALRALGLYGANKLQVIEASGEALNAEDYKLVIISAMVPGDDKLKIAWNLRQLATGDGDPLLILRSPADATRSLLYQNLPGTLSGQGWLEPLGGTETTIGDNDPIRSTVYHIRPLASVRRGDDAYIMSAQVALLQPQRLTI